jgi:SWI/SNF-related matrix-associated actin-dependent regulator of chromatin subfamily A member 5
MNDDGDETIRLTSQPSILKGGSLKDYQMVGLNWLISLHELGINGILADQMGLGKTIQAIAFLAFLKEHKKISGPHLVVAPNTTLTNWVNEFHKWFPSCRVVKLYARKELREVTFDNELIDGQFDVCVTSYEAINICQHQLRKFRWSYLIVDEAHRLKNEMSIFSQNLRRFKTNLKLLITGTPLQNNLHELWSLLNFILPRLFDSSDIFDQLLTGDSSTVDSNGNSVKPSEEKTMEIISSLHKILKPFILRRTKENISQALPPKKEIQVYVGLSAKQVELYKSLLLKKGVGLDSNHYMNLLMQLRKVCNHPYLFEGIEDENLPMYGDHLMEMSGKMVVVDKLLKKLYKGNHRVLIFSQMTSMLNILEDYCLYKEWKYCRIDGDTDIEERDKQIEGFNKPGSKDFIFLLSTRAGGLGINLATADTVVLYDSDWNPQVDLQAMDRAHRLGQTRPVNVYRLVTQNTVEEKILERQAIKLKWDHLLIQKGRMQQKNKELNKEELESLVTFGASEIFKNPTGTITDEDIDTLLQRGLAITNQKNLQIEEHLKKTISSL